jgi:putative FmdB family regulatory protein
MPVYEYRCEACEHEFEFFHRSLRADEKVECPSCGRGKVARKLSVFSAGRAEPASAACPMSPGPAGCGGCPGMGGGCPM